MNIRLAVLLFLAGCAAPYGGADLPMPADLVGSQDLAPYAGALRPMVVTLAIDTEDRTEAICAAVARDQPRACVTEYKSGRRCVIHLPLPRDHRDSVWAALAYHEFLHCQDGDWHR